MMFDPITYIDEMGLMKAKSWSHWRTIIKSIYGFTLEPTEIETYGKLTARTELPTKPFEEVYIYSGRRSGKSYMAATLAVVTALWGGFEKLVAKGERVMIFVVAQDKAQAQVVMDYCRGILDDYDQAVETITQNEIRLKSGVVISIRPASMRAMRGYSTALVVLDEFCFFRDKDGVANPVDDIIASLTPTILPGGKLLAISTPYARSGYAFEVFEAAYGKNNEDVLVVKAETLFLNPEFSARKIQKEFRRDAIKARTEWNAEFRSDLETYVSREILDEAILPYESLVHTPGREFRAFVDVSGGSRDRYALAISYADQDGKVVVARLKWFDPPFDPSIATDEAVKVIKEFRLQKVTGDKYAAGWVSSAFQKRGVLYEAAGKSKSEIYLDALALLNMRKIALPEIAEMKTEILALERKTRTGGHDIIDHAPGGRDDLANAALGAAVLAYHEIADRPTDYELDKRLPSMKRRASQPGNELEKEFVQMFAGYSRPVRPKRGI